MMVKYLLDLVFDRLKGKKWYKLNVYLFYKTLKNLEFGAGGDPQTSGERHVIKTLNAHAEAPVIIDCGANLGQYADLVIDELNVSSYRLICFEPSRITFEKLTDHLQEMIKSGNVMLVNEALSDNVGEARLFSDAEDSKFASLSKLDLQYTGKSMSQVEMIKTTTIDHFMATEGLSKVDLLKLDVEGHEFTVLSGARKALSSGSLRQIQFEFGKTNIDTRIFFKDFHHLLSDKYTLYRVFSWGLEPLPEMYLESQEIFYCTNFLARWKG